MQNFSSIERAHNVVELLTSIKSISCRFDSRTYFLEALIHAKVAFYCFKQNPDEGITDYYARLRKVKDVMKHYSTEITNDLSLIKHELLMEGMIDSMNDLIDHLVFDQVEFLKQGADQLEGFVFINGLDAQHYGELQKDLKKSLITKSNTNPESLF